MSFISSRIHARTRLDSFHDRFSAAQSSAAQSSPAEPSPSAIAAFRSSVASKLGLPADATNAQIFSAFDGAVAQAATAIPAAPQPTLDDLLYTMAWGADSSPTHGSSRAPSGGQSTVDLVAAAGWGK